MLHHKDFRSIWELAHVWAGYGNGDTGEDTIPEAVEDKLQKLIWGFLRKKISLRRRTGRKVFDEPLYFLIFDLNRARVGLSNAVINRRYERRFLSSVFAMRSEILKWCEDEFLLPPSFWTEVKVNFPELADKSPSGRHKDDEINKELCQAIARTLWDFDQRIHPAHMASHKAIRKYGNGALYKDDETVRGWIAEVDPLSKERKTGRPPAIRYLLDLENGGFNKEFLSELDNQTSKK